ncbi:hypothetical protein [Streptomyces sp. LaBMicrA B280]|uniref:hypothetical protein n=1 Tax=Streptomyces sp. LaBMicrA B280 TaxID=3391001 RepID=UPI003BA6CADE
MSLLPRAEDRVSAAEAVRHTRGAAAPAVPPDARERHERAAGHPVVDGHGNSGSIA